MSIQEQAARRILLAQAIETADAQGRLLGTPEREAIDRDALQAAQAAREAGPAPVPEPFLARRAEQVLNAALVRAPGLAALLETAPWRHGLAPLALLAALVLGMATDRVANPHRVDLLSLPLLAIVGWNLVVYLFLVVGLFTGRRASKRAGTGWLRWAQGLGGRTARLHAGVRARFMQLWQGVSAPLQGQRLKKVLHLAAAGWALGVTLSLVTRGLVVEYRVGWESTFLQADQVHALLRVLLMPALALLPFDAFTPQEIAALQFSRGGGGAEAGARWVWLYATLLAVVVVVPRLLLAGWAAWRERWLARHVALDLDDPYFQRLLAMLSPARVMLGLAGAQEAPLRVAARALLREQTAPAAGEVASLLRSTSGDELGFVCLPWPNGAVGGSLEDAGEAGRGWRGRFSRWLGSPAPREVPPAPAALVPERLDALVLALSAPAELDTALPLLRRLGRPVLVLLDTGAAPASEAERDIAQCRARLRDIGPGAQVLALDAAMRCWVQDTAWLGALAGLMPPLKQQGFARLAQAWQARNRERLAESMRLIAALLSQAAREAEEVRSAPLSFKSLVSPAERQEAAQARKDAMAAVVERLQRQAVDTQAALLRLHGFGVGEGALVAHRLEEDFTVREAVSTPQAGMAGAATGAAMGASVDLLTGGLTLGAAAALGALVGGGAAFVAAAWKNRATPSGSTVVQLSDEMLQALAEAALLRYLAVVDQGFGSSVAQGPQQYWKSEVVAVVEGRREALARLWQQARATQAPAQTAAQGELARELLAASDQLLVRLYPGSTARWPGSDAPA